MAVVNGTRYHDTDRENVKSSLEARRRKMGRLSARQRGRSAVIRVKGAPPSEQKFPIPDEAHARAALARIDQAKPPLTPAQKARVRAAARRKLGKGKA
jgi:hypothetical protein